MRPDEGADLQGEWYESGTGLCELHCKALIAWRVELDVPIHHRGDGEAAGEWVGYGRVYGH